MGYHRRATVVKFHVPAGSAGRQEQPGPSRPGVLVHLWEARDADMRRNQTWDRLLTLAGHAWTWRDPESIEEFEECLLRLSVAVETEWS